MLSALLATSAQAEPWLAGVHALSLHDRAGFESVTQGLYVQAPSGWTGGVLRNSLGRTSVYLGRSWQSADGRWSLTAGGISGYPAARIVPLLVPSARVGLGAAGALRLSFIPRPPGKGGAAALHLSLERSFD
jgi:hypothetical protein